MTTRGSLKKTEAGCLAAVVEMEQSPHTMYLSLRRSLALIVLLICPLSTAADAPKSSLRAGDAKAILAAIKKPGAKAVLVNVWATWCEPCINEMPILLDFYRAHRKDGLRLVLISVDDEADHARVAGFLAAQGVDFPTWIKRGDNEALVRALDPEWAGELPASFVFDSRGKAQQRCYGPVTEEALRVVWEQVGTFKKGRSGSPPRPR